MISVVIRRLSQQEAECSAVQDGYEILELSPNEFFLAVTIHFGYNQFNTQAVVDELLETFDENYGEA